MSGAAEVEGLLRELAPQVLGTLVRRYRDFDTCEDAVQEALLAAAVQWPSHLHEEGQQPAELGREKFITPLRHYSRYSSFP